MSKRTLSVFVAAVMVTLGVSSVSANVLTDLTSGLSYSANGGVVSGKTNIDVSGSESTNGIGFTVGGSATKEINADISLSVGAEYKALKSETKVGSTTTEYKYNYLNIPVVASYNLPVEVAGFSFAAQGGAYVSYLLSAEQGSTDVKDITYDGDYGVRVGASASMDSPVAAFNSVALSVSYDIGLKEIAANTKNSGLNFGVAAQF